MVMTAQLCSAARSRERGVAGQEFLLIGVVLDRCQAHELLCQSAKKGLVQSQFPLTSTVYPASNKVVFSMWKNRDIYRYQQLKDISMNISRLCNWIHIQALAVR
jgi:hypothetical protein